MATEDERFWQYQHPLTSGMPLLSPLIPVTSAALYVAYCILGASVVGQFAQSEGSASRLNQALKHFNRCRVYAQLVVGVTLLYYGYRAGTSAVCAPIPDTSSPELRSYPMKIAWTLWAFYLLKVVDLLDCIFVIHRGAEVNSLQMYHHASLVALSFAAVKYYPGGSTIVPIIINCCSQFAFYYFHQLNKMQVKDEQIPFQTALYSMQAIQFSLILLHTVARVFHPSCEYPVIASVGLAVYIVTFAAFVILFWNVDVIQIFGSLCNCGWSGDDDGSGSPWRGGNKNGGRGDRH